MPGWQHGKIPLPARQSCIGWRLIRAILLAGLYYGRVLVSEGRLVQALPVLQGLCVADPEFTEAVELLLKVVEHLQDHRDVEASQERPDSR